MNTRTKNVNSILEGLHTYTAVEDIDSNYVYIIIFSDSMGSYSRVLLSDKKLNENDIKKFYTKFCKEMGYTYYSTEDGKKNQRMVKILVRDGRVDNYDK